MKKTLKKFKLLLVDIIKLFFYRLFTFLPINNNLIIFESSRGLSYSCNPKYIYEGLLELNRPFTYIWSFQNVDTKTKGMPIKVRRFSLKYYYYLSKAKYWVQNGEFGKKIKKRKSTIYINTQHGTPLKKMGIDIPHFNLNKKSYDKTKKWDYLISPNSYTSQIFQRAYMYKGKIMEIGYPRNDILYSKNTPSSIQMIKAKFNIPEDKKIILYAPTYRDYESNKYIKQKDDTWKELKLDLNRLSKELSYEYILIIRAHHLTSRAFITGKFQNFIYDFSGAAYDIQELYLISDILITDYSSVMFDFANLNRPIIFFTYDLEEYSEYIRGMYFDIREAAPGPLVFNNKELLNALKNIDRIKDEYKLKSKLFYDKFCYIDDGYATKRLIETFFN